MVYLAYAGQRIHVERSANKGRGLKIANDHKLVKHIEQKIGKEKYSPDALIGEIHAKNILFEVKICVNCKFNCPRIGKLSSEDLS